MRHFLNLRLPASARRPRGPHSRPRLRAALAVTALAAMTLVGGHTAAYAATDAPYGGTAAAVPGTVQAENYDTGGQGTAYSVAAVNGADTTYRSDAVDLELTTDTGGGDDLGWTTAGQWFKYTVNAAAAGTYAVSLRLAAPTAVADGLHIANAAGTNLSGNIAVPATGGYQNWTTVTASVTLTAGVQTLTFDQDAPGWNINYATFSNSDAPYGGTAAAVPGTVQAENYDTGGQGAGYSVTAVNGSGNSYRSDGVDLETTSDSGGGYDLGWTGAGQWFKYTVNAATAATYTVSLRLAAPAAVADGLHIANAAGANLSCNIAVPATGGYQTWVNVTATVALPAGQQTLTFDQDAPGWNINYATFASSGGGGGTGTGGSGYGGFPASFWGNTSTIPGANGAIEFDFLNATNGQYPDSEVYWDVNGVEESIAQSPYYTMSSCNSCRVYFYLGSPNSQYNDFIELNSNGTTINADTSRVDAFGLPLAIHLHNSDGSDTVVGEDDQVFSESRTALFQQFENYVPAAFQQLATVNAPYSIPAPSDVAAFQPGGADANYMVSYAASEGATETTQQVFGCQGGGSPALSGDPSLCAGLNRCVAQFSTAIQNTPADYYKNAPCNYYSAFWHSVAVNNLQYGFAYDDDNGQSSDFNSADAQYVQVAIGF